MATKQLDLEPIAGQMEHKPDTFMVLVEKLQNMPPEAIGAVLDSYERFLKIQAKQAYDLAMDQLKKSIPVIVKNKLADMNGKYSYKYADLDSVCTKLDPVLSAHGFGYRWTTHPSDKGVTIGCIMTHVQGHSEETLMPVAPHDTSGGKNPIQAIGSTLSYLQRYSLLMALGIAPKNTDTDGVIETHAEMPGLEDWCTAIRDAHNFDDMDKSFREAYSKASALKNKAAKDAIAAAREEWRKKRKVGQ